MFHRVDDPYVIDCARYFRLAELLPCYDGAVRFAVIRDLRDESPADDGYASLIGSGAGVPGAGPVTGDGLTVTHDDALPFVPHGVRGQFSGGGAPVAFDDIAGLAAMSQQPGFPSIEYQGG